MKSFDLISDLHLDKWISPRDYPVSVLNELTRDHIRSLLPASPSKVLVIAGDLGHFNGQNRVALETLKEVYEYILLVRGNHDLYLVREVRDDFSTSLDRWKHMKESVSHLENVYFLEGDTVLIDNVTFGGIGMWYDMQYGVQVGNHPKEFVEFYWRLRLNDNRYIKGLPSFEEEYAKLEDILFDLDVVITHVGPDWTHVRYEYYSDKDLNSFYFFDGQTLVERARGKIWCYGHIHEPNGYTYKGCRLINNAMGYPRNALNTKIKTVFL